MNSRLKGGDRNRGGWNNLVGVCCCSFPRDDNHEVQEPLRNWVGILSQASRKDETWQPGYQVPFASCQLPSTFCLLPDARHFLFVVGCQASFVCCQAPFVCCQLPGTFWLLSVVKHLCCQLLGTFCLLSDARHFLVVVRCQALIVCCQLLGTLCLLSDGRHLLFVASCQALDRCHFSFAKDSQVLKLFLRPLPSTGIDWHFTHSLFRYRSVKLREGVISAPKGGWDANSLYIAVVPAAEKQVSCSCH